MSDDLRWILLAAGVVLIAGVYLWGLRARRRSAAPEHERVARQEPPMPRRAAAAATHRRRARPGAGGERRVATGRAGADVRRGTPAGDRDRSRGCGAGEAGPVRTPRRPQRSTRPSARRRPSRRVFAAAGSPRRRRTPFDGRGAAGGGRGRAPRVRSLPGVPPAARRRRAGVQPREPQGAGHVRSGDHGRRDLSRRGPVRGAARAARRPRRPSTSWSRRHGAIAGRLGGLLQDERGAALSVARLEQLRAELVAYERSRSPAAGL